MNSVETAFGQKSDHETNFAAANPDYWRSERPKTDFTKHSAIPTDILSDGPPRDGIPLIDDPSFKLGAEIEALDAKELGIGVSINGYARAYPLRVMMRHKIINDVTLYWTPDRNSAFDTREISEGRDVGNVTATKFGPDGPDDVPYFVDIGFAYHVFFPDRKIHVE